MPSISGVGPRAIATATDQALSSATNFLILLAALRTLPIAELGAFTLVYTTALLILVLVRPLSLEPLMIRFSATNNELIHRAAREAVGLSLVVGLGSILVGILLLLMAPAEISGVALFLSLAVTALLVQDGWRYHFLTAGRPWSAALNDGLCLLGVGGALVIALAIAKPTVILFLAAWCVGTCVGVVAGMLQAGIVPNPFRALAWLKATRDLGFGLVGEVIFERLAGYLSLLAVGWLAGAAALGEVGAARTLMTPVTTLTSALVIFAVPEAARITAAGDTKRLATFTRVVSLALAAAVLVFTIVVAEIPPSIGVLFVGENWQNAAPLLVPVGVWTAAAASRLGPMAALRALEKSALSARLSLIAFPIYILATGVGAYRGGSIGASWGFALSNILSAALWWFVTLRIFVSETHRATRA